MWTFPGARLAGGLSLAVLLSATSLLTTSTLASGAIGTSASMGKRYLNTEVSSDGDRLGRVRAGDSKTACIDANIGSTLRTAEHATGVTFRCVETFSNADPTWGDWVDPWVTQPAYGFAEWLAADPTERTIVLTQNVIPDSEATNPNWREDSAAGEFSVYARELADNLVSTGFGYSVIRLGSEMNGDWALDTIGDTPSQWRQWAQCFARIVGSMRAVNGAHFLFDWNVNAGYRDIPLADFYPGNAAVDIVGIDDYDLSAAGPLPPVSSPQRWSDLSNEPDGLYTLYTFARQHDKPLSIPEWGTVETTGAGDDGTYVTDMGKFVASHDVAYQSWFDAGDDTILPLSPKIAPRSVRAYAAVFGGRGTG